MSRVVRVIFIFMALILPFSAFAGQIHIQTKNGPPFNMSLDGKDFAREDNIKGIATEVLQETFKRAKVPYRMTLRPQWKRIYEDALSRNDYGVFSAAYTDERKSKFKWVGPLVTNEWVVFVNHKSNIKINALKDLNNYKVGSLSGNAVSRFLLANGIQTKQAATDAVNALKLDKGLIDAWVVGYLPGLYHASFRALAKPKKALTVKTLQMYLALNKNIDDETVSKLQSALEQVKADGTYDKIISRYLSQEQ